MMALANPYSPHRPIEHAPWFIDQKEVIAEIQRCLEERKMSCAIIGGEGMGKTSILKRIEKIYSRKANADQSFIPIYFEPDLRSSDSLRSTYLKLIHQTISRTKDWLEKYVGDVREMVFDAPGFLCRLSGPEPTTPDEDYDALEGDLNEIIKAILDTIANTKLLFLLDDIFRIKDRGYRNTFVDHWLELLYNNDSHLAIVVTCLKDHREQFDLCKQETGRHRGLGLVEPINLCVFKKVDSYKVVNIPLKETLNLQLTNEVADEIHNFTGGYPLFLQSAMSDLWSHAKTGEPINIACVQGYFDHWTYRHSDICEWINGRISEDEMLNHVLKQLRTGEIRTREDLKPREGSHVNVGRLRVALKKLQCWGVVCEMEKHVYRISGELFREWFLGPPSAAQVDEMNYRSEIDELGNQIARTIKLLDQHRDIEGVVRIRERLVSELGTLATDRTQLVELEKSMAPENPMRADAFRKLMKDVQRIKHYMLFDVRPQLSELGIQLDDIGHN